MSKKLIKKFNLMHKFLSVFLAILMLTSMMPRLAYGAVTPPDTISAPLNLGVGERGGNISECTISAPDDLRALLSQTSEERGYAMKLLAQIDFKIDNGDWHHTSAWDDPETYEKYSLNYYNSLVGGRWKEYLGAQGFIFSTMFPDEKNAPPSEAFKGWDWYKTHSITYRARFAVNFYNNNGIVFSDWSEEYILSDKVKMDYKNILNSNAPKLTSSVLTEEGVNKVPTIWIDVDQHSNNMQKLNAASSNSMWMEVWMRKDEDKEFKKVGEERFNHEKFMLDVSSYYKGSNIKDFSSAAYELKIRYKLDESDYKQSGATSLNWLYSPFSNTLSYGMPAWSEASPWATDELKEADELGLIPDSLKGKDLTQKITREEFAELALLMYQKATGITDTAPVSPNPFSDTTNTKVLAANNLGITKGFGGTTQFKPKELINREQVAAMLVRTIKLIAPNADYSTIGAPTFADQKDISDWALNDCLYIAKIGIIKGSDGKFKPKDVSEAQKSIQYAETSRQEALLMSVRTVKNLNN